MLCLLTYDGQLEERDRIMQFNKSVGLPVTLDELEISREDLVKIADKAASVVEWTYVPGLFRIYQKNRGEFFMEK